MTKPSSLHTAEGVLPRCGPGRNAVPALGRRRGRAGEQALQAVEHGLESKATGGSQEPPAENAMIEVYSWATPNGHKVHIMLEECGLPYRAHAVDIGAGDQFKPEFLAISPNNKIPAIVDPDGPDGKPISLFESGAILLYLAGKTGRFLPADAARQVRGAAVADVPDGRRRPDARPGAPLPHLCAREDPLRHRPLHQRGQAPVRRDEQAAGQEHATSAAPSTRIADIAIFPWLRSWKNQGIDWNDYPHLKGWFDEIARAPGGASAASRCWPTSASRWSTTRRARRCSARRSTSRADRHGARRLATRLLECRRAAARSSTG